MFVHSPETTRAALEFAASGQSKRGLIESDGSRYVANQRVGGKIYNCVRYAFANRSEDIKRIFCDHLDLLGIGWTRPNAKLIAIDRRPEVAKLDSFIGPKF